MVITDTSGLQEDGWETSLLKSEVGYGLSVFLLFPSLFI